MLKTCSILFFENHLTLAPTVLNLSMLIEKYVDALTIFAIENKKIPLPEKIGTNGKIVYFPEGFNLYNFSNQMKFFTLSRIIEIFIFNLQIFGYLQQSENKDSTLKTNLNIAVDFHGLAVALVLSYLYKQKFVFVSLELEELRKFGYISKPFYEMAKLAYRKAEAVIVQDEDRFKALSEYCQYNHPKVFYLPNAPLNGFLDNPNGKNFFREKFNLSGDKFPYIVLYAGMLNDDLYLKTLAESFVSIDNGCALVFHGADRRGIKEGDDYAQSLRKLNSKNLFLSLDLLPYEELSKIYSSSTIGIAFYKYINDNFGKIAKASGKLAQYLKHGKPVLVNNIPSLSQLVEEYEIGIVINDPFDTQEIKSAIDKILSSYDFYSKNAKSCFESEFNFEKKVEPILSFINSL
ncbi:glycosyltransferase [Aetokthonos hydrillicola Thurmond2011]|jgi:glycosyltransferase involved in cell wall biosynthesis|uniref:Glycosyltransferase n=1 Tax=Aetokthonos hydrillicola Thurmond2011 TaxID=2712845 RepID=A0AAP5IEJ9_9CYAN|nr:glycosyltransferase [Aetokthonos hydrillicola]MBO3457165.1 glycosyltransferase family 4 protein [Aetokthonos hydrillicola CCALA 1050]MBW4587516.1 glycosyltransferase [Aetokthonos hydrillicola CCALA 1050]MDR9898617.1 glycosyltransferase [Aetokthonos hydrillicola Thurmond2011]